MKIRIELLSDTICGSGLSIPGEEDCSIAHDVNGFPLIKGTMIRGILKEEMENYLEWAGSDIEDETIRKLFGQGGMSAVDETRKIHVSDFMLSPQVREIVIKETEKILDTFSYMRTFTALENGMVKDGSLRIVRCMKKGLIFYGTIECSRQDESLIEEVLGYIKWIGHMKTRGLGRVKISAPGGTQI